MANPGIKTKIESKQTSQKNEVVKNKSNDLINKQLIIVLAKKSSDTKGFLMKYEFINNQWKKVDQTIDVTSVLPNFVVATVVFCSEGQAEYECTKYIQLESG